MPAPSASRDVQVANDTAIAVGEPGGAGGSDVLVRFRAKDGKWSEVTHDGMFGGDGNQQAYGVRCQQGRLHRRRPGRPQR